MASELLIRERDEQEVSSYWSIRMRHTGMHTGMYWGGLLHGNVLILYHCSTPSCVKLVAKCLNPHDTGLCARHTKVDACG